MRGRGLRSRAWLGLMFSWACVGCTTLSLDDLRNGAQGPDAGPDGGGDSGADSGADAGDDAAELDPDDRGPRPQCEGKRDGAACVLNDDQDGVCVDDVCAQCASDDDCAPTPLTCREAFCSDAHVCSTRPVAKGSACTGGFCNADAQCVECALDENCDDNEQCDAERCGCKPGYAPNTGDAPGCNFDECALEDANRCAQSAGNTCTNSDDDYGCACEAPWKLGDTDDGPQCFQGGDGTMASVPNGSTWSFVSSFSLVCNDAFVTPPPAGCPVEANGDRILGHLIWLNVCGLGDPPCNTLAARGKGLLAADLQRVSYSAPLESYGDPTGEFTVEIQDPAPGDVILVRTLGTLAVMRIIAFSNGELSFEWATVWRDHCFLPGGATCTAECNCPDGS